MLLSLTLFGLRDILQTFEDFIHHKSQMRQNLIQGQSWAVKGLEQWFSGSPENLVTLQMLALTAELSFY